MTSDLVASSSITHQPKNLRYDVFLSFRRDDTRDNFVSHVHKALSDHQIKTFIDYNLSKGDDFPPALFTAIEESLISIIIFSENYADSTWCLKELAKIMECKNSNEQIVLPVFYGVDPSQVRNQTGNFGAAFDWLQECSKGKMNFDKARYHLMEVANISGWDSHVIRSKSQLITGIVGDVLRKLNLFSFSYSTNLVGVFPHVEKVESLLCLDSLDVSVVGIWGMGGIGKSTIARAVFNHISQEFDASHFVSNLQDELKRQSLDTVRESLLLKIFEKECLIMGTHSLVPDFIRRQLPQKKVFIVLDDVHDPIQLKELLEGQNYSFGSGSKILITSRDRKVLKSVTDKIHTMEAMNEKDAMTLFSLNAFKQKYPTNSYIELSKRAIYYADSNPLALVVLGSALFDRSKELWVSVLEGLEKEPNIDIKNVLRSSYDTLSTEEKEIFLDIAFFFSGKSQDFINQYYDNSVIFKIKTLEDKCLVTISSSNTIEMHDLLKEIGHSIDRENYEDKPEKRDRLWNPEDVRSVLTKKTGAAKIEALSMDMCKIKEVHLDGDVFGGMDSLRYLKFFDSNVMDRKNNVYFNGGRVEYLPSELRYFQWDGFPAKHLPSKFNVENLTELSLDGSMIEELWREDRGNHTNLQVLSLRQCSNLIKIPDVSKAKGLRWLDLSGCKRCGNVPSMFVSKELQYVDLSNCLKVRRFPDISSKSLTWLDLSGTDIEKVPPSIEHLCGLEDLNMNDCRRLSTISTNICKLKCLTSMQFTGCIKLERFPEILEPMENLKKIWLVGCKNLNISTVADAIPSFSFLKELHLWGNNCEMLPENMDQLANLQYLNVSGSERLRFVPKLPSSLKSLYAECCVSLESISIGVRGNKLKSLLLTNCFKLQEETRNQILAHSHFMMTQLAEDYKFYVLPGTEIPEWMGMGVGSCVTIKFPSSHDIEYWSQFRGFGFCVVFSAISPQYRFNFQCILKQNDHVICRLGIESVLIKPVTEHLFMWRCVDDRVSELDLNELMGKEVSFEFSMFEVLMSPEGSFDVLKCGVQLLFENTAPLPTSLISSATNTEDDQLLISASSSIPPSPEKPTVEIKLTGMELSELPKAEEWKVSKLIHLNDSQLLKLPENPSCPVLEDLSLKGNSKIRTIPPLFFDSMPALSVLDLSRTRIKSLPDSLFSLPKLKRLFLKHCNLLMKLSPKVGQLKGLQVLDLEGTEIMNLPEEVKELENLMCLKVSFCELQSYRRVEEPNVLMISPGTLSALPLLEELSINVSPDDGRWNESVEHVVSEVSGLALLYKLQFYFPSMEFLSRFKWSRIKAFKLTAGPLAAKRLMPRLPSDAEAELERCDKSFTSVHGDFESEMNNPVLQHADALFLDRHTTMKPLSTFGLDSFKHIRCCVVGECNELQVLFCAGQKPPHVSLEYLYLYYMKSLRHVWEGRLPPMVHLKSLALRTCPMLSSIFSEDLIGSLNSLKSLQEIIIDDCPAIINLVRCNGFECTSSSGTAHNNFLPRLKRISLHYLPQLNDIFDLSRSRYLEWMSIYHCPNLKSLPIDTTSNKKLNKIMGERSWWESLEWQDTKQHSWDDVFVEQELCY